MYPPIAPAKECLKFLCIEWEKEIDPICIRKNEKNIWIEFFEISGWLKEFFFYSEFTDFSLVNWINSFCLRMFLKKMKQEKDSLEFTRRKKKTC